MNSGRLVFWGVFGLTGVFGGLSCTKNSPEPKSSPVWRTTARSCITANTGTYPCPRMSAGPPWTAHQRAQAAISRPTGRDQLSDRAQSGGQVLPCKYTSRCACTGDGEPSISVFRGYQGRSSDLRAYTTGRDAAARLKVFFSSRRSCLRRPRAPAPGEATGDGEVGASSCAAASSPCAICHSRPAAACASL
jgi:hypothetical protein